MPETNALLPPKKKRYIGAQLEPDAHQTRSFKTKSPKPIQCQQRGGRVTGAATQTGLSRNALLDANVCTKWCATELLQRPGGANDQVLFGQRAVQVFPTDLAIVADLEMQRVAPVNQPKHRLQQVITVTCVDPRRARTD